MKTATKALALQAIIIIATILPGVLAATASAETDYDTVDWEETRNRSIEIVMGIVLTIGVILGAIAGVKVAAAGSDANKRHEAYEGVKAVIIGCIIAVSFGGIMAVIRYAIFG